VTEIDRVAPADDHADTFGVPPDVYHRRWAIHGVLCISLVVIVINVSSLNVALPTIQEQLGASATQLQWIVAGYALVFAGLLLPGGALGDRFGRKGALQAGLTIFGLAALAASRSTSPSELIAYRSVMGVGAALIMPATLSIIVSSFPFAERPKAIALWAAFAGVGAALGPIASGLLLEHFWWGSVFFVNVPLVLLLLVLSAVIVPSSKDPNGHALDPIGALLSVIGLVSLVFAVIEGPELGWRAPVTIGGFVVAAVALFAFVQYERQKRNPMLDPRLFRSRGFSTGSAIVTLSFFNMFGLFFLLSQYLQFVKAYSPLAAGLRVLPSAFTLMLVSPQGPRLVRRFGVRAVVSAGFASAACGFGLMTFADAASSYLLIAAALVLAAAGIALIMPPASQLIVGSVPLSKAGVGSAVNDVTREVGGALGIAVVGSIVNSVYRARDVLASTSGDAASGDSARKSVGQALEVARQGVERGTMSTDEARALVQSAGRAFNDGTRIAFIVLTLLSTATAIVIGRLVPNELPSRPVPSPASGTAT
jgi:MFS transporter, DHA2 family, integral membrane protein